MFVAAVFEVISVVNTATVVITAVIVQSESARLTATSPSPIFAARPVSNIW